VSIVRNIVVPFQFLRQKMDYSVVPWCTYTDPEVAHVGLGEKEAKQKNVEYDLFVVSLEDVDRAVVESEEVGSQNLDREEAPTKSSARRLSRPMRAIFCTNSCWR
jgi:pyruvate/2-oxoglutarate dehydrogenase complex dihydrolipoamide dehydrogenase (E3) component